MRIAICDDHRLFSEALAAVLEVHGHTVVASTVDPAELIAITRHTPVDVCLVDLSFPDASGVDAVTALAQRDDGPNVIVLTATEDLWAMAEAVAAGARAVLRKDEPIEAVLDVLLQVSHGQTVLPADVLNTVRSATAHTLGLQGFFLTEREREVLQSIVSGASTKQVAAQLGIRYSTARTHVQNVLTKLGVHSKLEAVAVAVTNGLLPTTAS